MNTESHVKIHKKYKKIKRIHRNKENHVKIHEKYKKQKEKKKYIYIYI